jgi:GMP synthase-like glutamine amidotransferase
MKRKIYVVGGHKNYANWMQGEVVDDMRDADLVVFTGGEDVSPGLYRERANPKTYSNHVRDTYECQQFRTARELGKHMIGICRGSQLLCALNGGRLVQHQDNPHFVHPIITSEGKVIPVSSTHHQAMYPYDMSPENYRLLAWTQGISNTHQDGSESEMHITKEAEICYFPKTKALGIQGHPEMMSVEKYPETFEYLYKLLDDHLNDRL